MYNYNKIIKKYKNIKIKNKNLKKKIEDLKEKNKKINQKLLKIKRFIKKNPSNIAKKNFDSKLNIWWIPDDVHFDIYIKNIKLIQKIIEKYLEKS